MSAPAWVRHVVDKAAPSLATWHRRFRDKHTRRYQVASTTPWGFELYGDLGLATSRWQSNEADQFEALVQEADHVIDVGANVGLFTLLAGSHGVPVTAIEPSPMNLVQLYRNLQLNGGEGVEVLPVAVGDSAGVVNLYGGGQGASLRTGWGGMVSTYTTTVAVHTLDGLSADRLAGKRVVIKIDAEGSELPILRGARRLMTAEPAPAWIVEVGLTENFNGGVNPDFKAIFDLFWAAGYTSFCVEVPGRQVRRADVDRWVAERERGFWNMNYLFQRPTPSHS